MNKIVTIAALFGAATLASGCNTMEGFGKDLQAAGNAIAGTAKKDEAKKSSAPAPAPAAAAPAPAPMAAPSPAPMAAPPPPQPVRR